MATERKKLVTRIKDNFWFWVGCVTIAALPLILASFFIDDLNVKLNKTMTCTVESTKVESETYSIGNGNGSATHVVVDSKDCHQVFFGEMPDGIRGTDDLQKRLKPGHKYTFVYSYVWIPWDTTKVYSFTEA